MLDYPAAQCIYLWRRGWVTAHINTVGIGEDTATMIPALLGPGCNGLMISDHAEQGYCWMKRSISGQGLAIDLLGKMKDEILRHMLVRSSTSKPLQALNISKRKAMPLKRGLDKTRRHRHPSNHHRRIAALADAEPPHLREMGTIGGNICQDIRCWLYSIRTGFPAFKRVAAVLTGGSLSAGASERKEYVGRAPQ